MSIVVLYSEKNTKLLSQSVDSISSAIRAGDEVTIVELVDSTLRMPPRFKVTRGADLVQSIASISSNHLCGKVVFFCAGAFVTRAHLDQIRNSSLIATDVITGPRSAYLPGYQLSFGQSYHGRSAMREFQCEWIKSHSGFFSSTPFLGIDGISLAKETFIRFASQLTDCDDLVELSWSIATWASENQLSMVVDDSQFLHSDAVLDYHLTLEYRNVNQGTGFHKYQKFAICDNALSSREIPATGRVKTPVLSLTMIAKDEEHIISGALSSVSDLVEEIFVLDTGSSDSTRDIVRSHGGAVGEFEWCGDFGKARQLALESVDSDWVLCLDADEEFDFTIPDILSELSQNLGLGIGLMVNIKSVDNLDISTPIRNQMGRILRRVDARWEGNLHEIVLPKHSLLPPYFSTLESGSISHFGYQPTRVDMQAKALRNVTISRDFVESTNRSAESLVHLGRSLLMIQEIDEAAQLFEDVIRSTSTPLSWYPIVLRLLIQIELDRGNSQAAIDWHKEFKDRFPHRADQAAFEMMILISLDRTDEALLVYHSLPLSESYLGDQQFDKSRFLPALIGHLYESERYSEALGIIIEGLDISGYLEIHPGLIVSILEKANVQPLEFYKRIPEKRRIPVFGFIQQLGYSDPEVASKFLLSLWKSQVQEDLLLACALNFVDNASLSDRLEWSAIARNCGQSDKCPLVKVGVDESKELLERVASLYVADFAFGDPFAHKQLDELMRSVDRCVLEDALEEIRQRYEIIIPMIVAGVPLQAGIS
ncbi:glycosyltransferase [Acidithrix sp. C25]|uniref:tetratricopeptide repeat-containing glycosyltransferase n=1 Tax=Acidithrix sp. C25 TaxID=1671482 RepID=UPI00191B98A6|nr:glycosyltransferase [Acidithrix sp. C25]CAG4933688.1 unnamed protein product [Acidithrix sp. C25]